MSDLLRPNLFTYATSELSQDAFICWLAAWADPTYEDVDPALHQAGQAFIVSMVRKVKSTFESVEIESVNIEPQFQKLDILIRINGDRPDKLAILVEDKTHTSNHHDQLKRYYDIVQKVGYQPDQMIPLYFKTGYQSKFDTIGEYKTYLRNDFLAVLQSGKHGGVVNAIYDDFLAHLQEIDVLIKQFSTKPVSKWGYHDWVGFFTVLYDQRSILSSSSDDDETNWGYVANPAGGFVGYWWYFLEYPNFSYKSYLQLENDTLCFKIAFSDERLKQADWKNFATSIKSQWSSALCSAFSELNSKYTKIGKTMTVAKLDNFLSLNQDGTLNLDKTISVLKKAEEIMDEARKYIN